MPVPFNDQQKHDITVTIRGLAEDVAGKPDNWPNWAAAVRSGKSLQARLEGQAWDASPWHSPVVTGGWDSKTQLTALLRPIVTKAATYLTTTQAQNLNVATSQQASRESAGTALTYQQQQASPVAPVVNVARETPAAVVETARDVVQTVRPPASTPVENPTQQVKAQLTTEVNSTSSNASRMSPDELLRNSNTLQSKLNAVPAWENSCSGYFTCAHQFEAKSALYGKVRTLIESAKQRQAEAARTAASRGLPLTAQEQQAASRPTPATPTPSAGSPCGMPWTSSPRKDEFLTYVRNYPNKPTDSAGQHQLMCQLWTNFNSRQPAAAPPPPSGPNFTDIAAGISSMLNPLASVGAGIFQAQQQAQLARTQLRTQQPAAGPQQNYYAPPSTNNNTLLIAGVAGGAVLLLLIVVLAAR